MSQIKYNIRTGVTRIRTKIQTSKIISGLVGLAAVPALILSGGAALAAGGYSFFGDAQIVSPGYNSAHAAQTRSSALVPPNYGGVDFSVPSEMTVADLNNLSTYYMFTEGSCGGGSPRFQINVETPTGTKNLFVYIGPFPNYIGCPQNIWINSGNLLSATGQDLGIVDASQLIPGGQYTPYAAVQAAFGSYTVSGIQVVTDAYWFAGTQTVRFDNVMINNTTYTFDQPSNKDECKNGGYQNLTDQNGQPFKNQGQCVSYTNGRGQ